MLMNCHSLATAIVVATSMMSDPNDLIANPEGGLSEELLMQLRDNYRMDDIDRARFNAVSNSDINKLALNRDIVRGEDGHFSHKIASKGITDQKSSGRCWMFAGFNVMRPKIIHELGLDEFEFSSAYLQFWDKMEKSNRYMEAVI